jgi:hypothetical protein
MKIGLIPWRALQTNLTAAGGYIITKEAMVAVALLRFNEAERYGAGGLRSKWRQNWTPNAKSNWIRKHKI